MSGESGAGKVSRGGGSPGERCPTKAESKLSRGLTLPFSLQTWTTRSLMHFITGLTETR